MRFFQIRTTIAILVLQGAAVASPKFHGPVIQWHREPTSSATFAWVEDTSESDDALGGWKVGKAGFGYGDHDDETQLKDMEDNYERVYLSNTFNLQDVPNTVSLTLSIRYDDAFVMWINGIEIARSSNLKDENRDAKVKGGHEAGDVETFILQDASGILQEGVNLVAVEGHNIRAGSSDFTLDPDLSVNGVMVIPNGAEWKYLAGGDPPRRWFLTEPSLEGPLEPVKRNPADWKFGIRLKGNNLPFTSVEIKDRQFGEVSDSVFEAAVDKLSPDSAYEYVLYADDVPVKLGWFKTAPEKLKESISFVVGGDMGTSGAIPVCKLAGREDPLFALIGGDLAYANGRSIWKWHDWLDNWTHFVVGKGGRDIPIIAGIGNHEMKSILIRKKDAPYYFSLFDLPTRHSNFTVDFANYMSIVLLDSNHTQKVSRQTQWLRGQLKDREGIPHLFSIYHRPAWGTGVKRNIKSIQEEWTPLFEQYGVDCVFENDHHTYKRTHKIVSGIPDDKKGVLHIGDGAWGARVRPISEKDIDRVGAEKYLAKWAAQHHLIKVTVDPNGMKHYEAKKPNGTIFDEFHDAGTPPVSFWKN